MEVKFVKKLERKWRKRSLEWFVSHFWSLRPFSGSSFFTRSSQRSPFRGRALPSLLFRYRASRIACVRIILRDAEKRFSLYMCFALAVKRHKYKRTLNNGRSGRTFCAVKMFSLRVVRARSRRRKVKNCEYVFGIVPLLCNFASCRFSICPSSRSECYIVARKQTPGVPASETRSNNEC